jgi:CubicO group peptidase (beta-lactamase class C family)
MRTLATVILLSLGVSVSASQPAKPAAEQPEAPGAKAVPRDITVELEKIRAKHKIPALGGAVVVDGTLTALGASGKRSNAADVPVTVDDLWHIGSCTKAMTATLCAVLVERGKLRWDSTCAEVFPELAQGMHEKCRGITLRQLLTNRSGLPSGPAPDIWRDAWLSPDGTSGQGMMLVKRQLALAPEFTPGERDLYSNVGFSIAGMMAERAGGKPYEELLTELVFTPLGITHAGFGPPGGASSVKAPSQPRGHRADGTPVEPGPAADNPPIITPAGRVHITLADWAKFVNAHAARGPLLKPESWDTLHTQCAPGRDGYAMGWATTHRPWAATPGTTPAKDAALFHNGSNTMWYCVTWFSPDRRLAVLVTTNIATPAAQKAADEAAGALISIATTP